MKKEIEQKLDAIDKNHEALLGEIERLTTVLTNQRRWLHDGEVHEVQAMIECIIDIDRLERLIVAIKHEDAHMGKLYSKYNEMLALLETV